jgi:hypothetical protein
MRRQCGIVLLLLLLLDLDLLLGRLVVRVACWTAWHSSTAIAVSACLGLGPATRRRWVDSYFESPRCGDGRYPLRGRGRETDETVSSSINKAE